MQNNIPPTLYHYCSPSTFLKIIESKKIHVSDLGFTNDYAELNWGFGLIKKILNDEIKNFPEKRDSIANIPLNLFQNTFVFCLSEDGDLLSQWRGYGCDGCGFAIGFDTQKFISAFNLRKISISTFDKKHSYCLDKVIYHPEELKTQVKEILTRYNYDSFNASKPLVHLCRVVKNDAFYQEKEWRIIHIPIEFNFEVAGNIQFYEKNNKIIPYDVMEFQEHKEIVKEIVIGPTNPNGIYWKLDIIELLLKKNGFSNIKLTVSRATFRNC